MPIDGGALRVEVPRDREACFEPLLIPRHQRRFTGLDDKIIGLFWMKVFNELRTRGVSDTLIAVTDGLKGMSEALSAVFPATTLQTCIVT